MLRTSSNVPRGAGRADRRSAARNSARVAPKMLYNPFAKMIAIFPFKNQRWVAGQ
jgi:hypothetical protein